MPSNADLIQEIQAIDPNAVVDGLKNADLAALLKYLKSQTVAPDVPLAAPDVPPVTPDVPLAAPDVPPGTHVVADGKCITSLRGVLSPGDAVKASDFAGGEDTINALLANGTLI